MPRTPLSEPTAPSLGRALFGMIRLVDARDRPVAAFHYSGDDPDRALAVAVHSYRAYEVRRGYVYDDEGRIRAQSSRQ